MIETEKTPLTFVGDIILSYLRTSHDHEISMQDNKQEGLDLSLAQNEKYIGAKITEITFKKERDQKEKTRIWIIDYGKTGRVQIISKFSTEQIEMLFTILNVKFPVLGNNPTDTPEMVPYESIIIDDSTAISEARLTAYNIQMFMRKISFYASQMT